MSAVTKIEHEPRVPAPSTPMEMLDRAIASGAGIEVLTKLMDLQDRWERNQGRRAYDEAMASAKAEIPVISKNRRVDFTSAKGRTNYRHEDLSEITRVVSPILAKHGLSYRFRTTQEQGGTVSVTCIVSHRGGHSEENTLSAGRDESGNKNNIQAVGSTITYLQRYTLKAALGLAAGDDDDGKAAGAAEPSGTVSDDQAATLRGLIEETGADIARFCAHFKVESIPELPAAQFGRAVKALEAKRVKP